MSRLCSSQGDKENLSFNTPKKLKRNKTNENLVLCSSNVDANNNGEKNLDLIDTKGNYFNLDKNRLVRPVIIQSRPRII